MMALSSQLIPNVALMNNTVAVLGHTGGEGEAYEWIDSLLFGVKTQNSLVGFGRVASKSNITESMNLFMTLR